MKKFLLSIICLLLLVVLFLSQIHLGILTTLFLWDLLDEKTVHSPDRGVLSWVTSSPTVEQLQIAREKEIISADLYYLQDHKKKAAILLTHGIFSMASSTFRARCSNRIMRVE